MAWVSQLILFLPSQNEETLKIAWRTHSRDKPQDGIRRRQRLQRWGDVGVSVWTTKGWKTEWVSECECVFGVPPPD